MGRQIDLSYLCGLPTEVTCLHCEEETSIYTDDVDLDCLEQEEAGVIKITFNCSECDETMIASFKLSCITTLVKEI